MPGFSKPGSLTNCPCAPWDPLQLSISPSSEAAAFRQLLLGGPAPMSPIRLTMPSTAFILPKGTYTLTVTGAREVEDTYQEKVLPAIQVYLATVGNADVPDGVAVYCRLYTRPDCLWKIATFHKATGLDIPVGDCEIDPESWEGLTLKARVEPRDSAGQTFNVAERFVVPKKAKSSAADPTAE